VALVAALRERWRLLRPRAVARRQATCVHKQGLSLLPLLACLALAGCIGIATTAPSAAQSFTFNPRPPHPAPPKVVNDNQMLVQANEVDYDYNNSRVSAVGNVQIFYNGTTV